MEKNNGIDAPLPRRYCCWESVSVSSDGGGLENALGRWASGQITIPYCEG